MPFSRQTTYVRLSREYLHPDGSNMQQMNVTAFYMDLCKAAAPDPARDYWCDLTELHLKQPNLSLGLL